MALHDTKIAMALRAAAVVVAAGAAAASAASVADVTIASASGPATDDAADYDRGLSHCPEGHCVGHGWEVLEGNPHASNPLGDQLDDAEDASGGNQPERRVDDSGVLREYDDGYGELVLFGGYSGTGLCAKYKRTTHIDGHTDCPLEMPWFTLWPTPSLTDANKHCWIDNIRSYQAGSKLNNAPGMEVRLGSCPGKDDDQWHGGYDFRYGGIRPQDVGFYPEVKAHIEASVNRTGKKVVIKGCSGGTINSYAFLMSQTLEWRKAHVMAWIAVSPVFGGTVSSMHSILSGWNKGHMDRCTGRASALQIPSVLWMWPPAGLWNHSEPLIMTKSRNYTAYDLDRMLMDMGLPITKKLYDLEKGDLLNSFPPPLIDTYVYYGYGLPTQAGFSLTHRDFSPETDGPDICPDGKDTALLRKWDDGDVTAPLRSVSRASAWVEAYKQAGVVLKNLGYLNNHHACDCTVSKCKTDYECMMKKLQGKPHGDC